MARAARFSLRLGIFLERTRRGGSGVADEGVDEGRDGHPSLSLDLRCNVMVVTSLKWKGREMMLR